MRIALIFLLALGCGAPSATTTQSVERVSGPALLLGAAVGASALQGAADRERRAERERQGPRTGPRSFLCPLDDDGGEEIRAESAAEAQARCHEIYGEHHSCRCVER